MKETRITVAEAARNFADCINRAHYENVTFLLLKNGKPFARIAPASTGGELAHALSKVELSPEEARAWLSGLRKARKVLKANDQRRSLA